MSKRKRKQVKNAIVELVRRYGIAVRAERIAGLLHIPKKTDVDDLLAELVEEGRLIVSRYTMDTRGNPQRLYNLPQTQ